VNPSRGRSGMATELVPDSEVIRNMAPTAVAEGVLSAQLSSRWIYNQCIIAVSVLSCTDVLKLFQTTPCLAQPSLRRVPRTGQRISSRRVAARCHADDRAERSCCSAQRLLWRKPRSARSVKREDVGGLNKGLLPTTATNASTLT
jgi:hypothetical protein